jgi:hypothetical protein
VSAIAITVPERSLNTSWLRMSTGRRPPRAWSSDTTHVPVPVQPDPLQPPNTEPAAGVAVSVTMVPDRKAALHVRPQSIPAGSDVTVPLPAAAGVTVSTNC